MFALLDALAADLEGDDGAHDADGAAGDGGGYLVDGGPDDDALEPVQKGVARAYGGRVQRHAAHRRTHVGWPGEPGGGGQAARRGREGLVAHGGSGGKGEGGLVRGRIEKEEMERGKQFEMNGAVTSRDGGEWLLIRRGGRSGGWQAAAEGDQEAKRRSEVTFHSLQPMRSRQVQTCGAQIRRLQ